MTIEIDGSKVMVFDKHCKELDLSGITGVVRYKYLPVTRTLIEIRAIDGEPTEAIFTASPDHVTIKDVTRASIQELDR